MTNATLSVPAVGLFTMNNDLKAKAGNFAITTRASIRVSRSLNLFLITLVNKLAMSKYRNLVLYYFGLVLVGSRVFTITS